MGLLGKIGGAIFGKSPKGYKSKNVSNYEGGAYDLMGNRAGARRYTDKKGRTQYDFSNSFAGKPIEGAAGVREASAGYDFSPTDQAINRFRAGPAKMNFRGLPEQYGGLAYEGGAKDIRRESAGQLEKLRESVGTRRPGLLLKAGQDSQRAVNEQLGDLNARIRLGEMEKNTDLDVQEQMLNEENAYKYIDALNRAGMAKIGMQQGLTEAERAYRNKMIDDLMGMYGQSAGINNQSAQIAAQNRAATLGFLGSMLGGASKAAGV